MGAMRPFFWELPLEALTREEWEALCDGCGKCCLHKLEDAETGEVHPTNVACKLLDRRSARCSNYRDRKAFGPGCVRPRAANVACKLLDRRSARCSNYRDRKAFVPDCVRLSVANVHKIDWLPSTCAYRLRGGGKPPGAWHQEG